jgi:hypothetical protein
VGFYGGINYGFGYIGVGYFGGYWRGHDFYYNRYVNHVPGGWGGRVYERPVIYNNVRYGMQPTVRISFNGGRGGIDVRPRPFEVAAMRERHEGPLPAQMQLHNSAMQNRAQFYNQNHGRPAEFAAARAVGNAHEIRETPAGVQPGRPGFNGNQGARPGQPENRQPENRGPETRPGQADVRPGVVQGRTEQRVEGQPLRPSQPAMNPGGRGEAPQRNEARPNVQNGQPNPAENGFNANRGATQHAPAQQAQPEHMNQPRTQPQPTHTQPQQFRETPANRPQPQPQQHVEQPRAQPQPQQHVEQPRAQPQQHMEAPHAAPAPHMEAPHAAPAGGGHENGGHEGRP